MRHAFIIHTYDALVITGSDTMFNDGFWNSFTKQTENFDFVESSHCIEDFDDIYAVLCEWLRVVKFGGYLCLLFPDEKVYRAKTRVRNLEHKHEDFGMDFVMQILENINKVKMLTKEYSLTVVKREECFEGDDYNCILVIQKEGAEVKQGLEPMFKTHYLGHFPRVD